jgi:periplasmic divalent cation tolerance protein
MPLLTVHTTVPTQPDADRLAQAAVGQRLAACVQVEAIHSTYVWQGAVQQGAELRLLFKTTADRYPALEALIQSLHPYELPAIWATPVTQASPAYARWVAEQTQSVDAWSAGRPD